MLEDFPICPFPGLRSFSEDESIYFKGRDHQVEKIIDMLQQNKFLMVTGASGDGKSSLIYAGLIPNAKAGFFKAHYNGWQVAHFRPERTPVKNFAKSLADQLNVENYQILETEFNRGFSALVDIYKNSSLFVNKHSEDWKVASRQEKETYQREAGNLLILVDQFEEFFTNPENFYQNVPSQESQTLVNLLLETARLALREDLPIYIVCTMRSDFIGQCAAFRGLPEYIGFSQFFVPRLKRKDLQQVIEEPCKLSGNKISRRLVERLLYDMSEGVDQLPILQHALNQIWIAADKGKEEMDLIHYAMVGGMDTAELPEVDQNRFRTWYNNLADYEKGYYKNTGLSRVVDIHADRLYQSAWQYFNHHSKSGALTIRQAKRAVGMTFACLTKIDQSRAVRNRMTLQEITDIIHDPELGLDQVNTIINYFREPGNTFIRPFISDIKSQKLEPDTLLDITHESLIRNWRRLDKWVTKEYEFYENYVDFKKQLNRWLENRKSSGYLLPIGPLSFFEEWYNQCSPNEYWINRYNDDIEDKKERLKNSKTILQNSRKFLQKSARKVIVTRTFMKYGARRIATVLGILLVVVLSAFYYFDAENKQNQQVLKRIEDRGFSLIKNDEVNELTKGDYLLFQERINPGTINNLLGELERPEDRINALYGAYLDLVIFDKYFKGPLKKQIVTRLNQQLTSPGDDQWEHLNSTINSMNVLGYDYYFNQEPYMLEALKGQAKMIGTTIINTFSSQKSLESQHVRTLMIGIEHSLNFGGFSDQDIKKLIRTISPFEAGSKTLSFEQVFPAEETIDNGDFSQQSHLGGYQKLAALYASIGDKDKMIQCMDTLFKYNVSYNLFFDNNNGYNLIGYLMLNHHDELIPDVIEYLSNQMNIPPHRVYNYLLDRSGHVKFFYIQKILNQVYNPVLTFLSLEHLNGLFDLYETHLRGLTDPTERNFLMSILLKQKTVFNQKYFEDKQTPYEFEQLYAWLDQSYQHYQNVDAAYLYIEIEIYYRYYINWFRSKLIKRSDLCLFPDHYTDAWHSNSAFGDVVVQYLLGKNLLGKYYQKPQDLALFNHWLISYFEVYLDQFGPEEPFRNMSNIDTENLIELEKQLSEHRLADQFDLNLLRLIVANIWMERGNFEKGYQYYQNLNTQELSLTANLGQYLNHTFFFNELLKLAIVLAERGKAAEAIALVKRNPILNDKLMMMSKISESLYKRGNPEAFVYLDSVFTWRKRIDDNSLTDPDYRLSLIHSISRIGGRTMTNMANQILLDVTPSVPLFLQKKEIALTELVRGIASEGNYHLAYQTMSADFAVDLELTCYNTILLEEAFKSSDLDWETFDKNRKTLYDKMAFRNQNS